MLVYSAVLAQYNVCTQCLQTLFNSIYRAPAQWHPLFFQAHANLKLVSDQSESDRSETQLKIWMVLLVTEVSQATLPQIYQKP